MMQKYESKNGGRLQDDKNVNVRLWDKNTSAGVGFFHFDQGDTETKNQMLHREHQLLPAAERNTFL